MAGGSYISVTITGTKDELDKLQKLGRGLTNFQSAMGQIGKELKGYYGGQVFASEGGTIGEAWAMLSPTYRRWKARHYPGRPILEQTGAMRHGFRSTADKTSVTIDNPDPKFRFHQLGTSKMPQRQMLAINGDVENIVKSIIKSDIETKLGGI